MGEFPNKATQFKKGGIGNPNGRGIGSVNIATVLEAILDKDAKRMDHYELTPKQQSIMNHMTEGLVAKALGKEGDVDSIDLKAIDMVFDRLEGKALAKTQEVPSTLEDALNKLEREDDTQISTE